MMRKTKINNEFESATVNFDWSQYPSAENSKRWTAALKRDLVLAIQSGVLTKQDVQSRYKDLSDEELSFWIKRSRSGLEALKVTKSQIFPKGYV